MNKDDTVAIIRSLLSSTNSSYSIYSLNKDFKNETGINIPLFGYNSISDFLSSIPETIEVTGVYPIQRVSLVTSQKSAHIVSLVKRQKNAKPKNMSNSKSKFLVRKITEDTSFRSEDNQETPLVSEKNDFCAFKSQNEDFKGRTPSNIKEVPPMDLDFFLSLNSSKRLIPLNYFYCAREIIPLIEIELHARVGEYVEVWPCEIFTPHKFYFNFRKFKKKFENFFEKFQIFYSTHEIPAMEKEIIRPKQVCAAFHKILIKPQWHRVEIQKIVSESRVIVNFIDCGKTAEISLENLKLLHRNFRSFPRQAVLGVLANIRPLKNGSKWSFCAIKKFYDLAFRKALIAGVVEIDSKTCCLKMALSCTKNSEIHINDALVKEGFAEFEMNVVDNHFINILKKTNLRSKAVEQFNSHESVLHKSMNNAQSFNKNSLNCVQKNIPPFLQTPIYFLNDEEDNNNKNKNSNNRLKKMFSLVKNE